MWFSNYWNSKKIGILHIFSDFRMCFYGDFKCPRAAEIQIFRLKFQFLHEIPKKPRSPDFTDVRYVGAARRVCSLTDITNQDKNAIFCVVYCMRRKNDVMSIDPLRGSI